MQVNKSINQPPDNPVVETIKTPAQAAIITPTDNTRPRKKSPLASTFGSTISAIALLLIAPLIAVLLTAFVFQSYQVDGPSMENTLHNNDRLIVWKMPRTWARITRHQFVPKRGDIVIFTQTGLNNFGDNQNTKQLVKRIIGLPGDRVVYKNGAYSVYNTANPKGFDPDKTLAYGIANTALITDTAGSTIDVTLNSHQVFVSGDHRADSLDSRYFGPIDTNQLIGKLAVRILPLSQAKLF